MEDLIATIAEKSLVGAGFLYLLYYLVQNMNKITIHLENFGTTLEHISHTLVKIDMRVETLEKRIDVLEGGEKHEL